MNRNLSLSFNEVTASSLREIVNRIQTPPNARIALTGVEGGTEALLIATAARTLDRPLVMITPDAEASQQTVDDLTFFLSSGKRKGPNGENHPILTLPAYESPPYADVNPDRRIMMERLATYFFLLHSFSWKVLVLSAVDLARKGIPRSVFKSYCEAIRIEEEIHPSALTERLKAKGYLSVPLVEDPGCFVLRGSLLDIWPPQSPSPLRVELYENLVLSIKEFDPIEQKIRTQQGADQEHPLLWLPPAREAIIDCKTIPYAKEQVRQLADHIDWPTTKTRALMEDVISGRPFFGSDSFLPAYYESLDPLFDYLPSDSLFFLQDPTSVSEALEQESKRVVESIDAKNGTPCFPISAFYQERKEIAKQFDQRATVLIYNRSTNRLENGDSEKQTDTRVQDQRILFRPCQATFDIGSTNQESLSKSMREARASKEKTSPIFPLVQRILEWHEQGLSVCCAARSQIQAERIISLLSHQEVTCCIRTETREYLALHQSKEKQKVQVAIGPLSRGFILPSEQVVWITEEEIFGAPVHASQSSKEREKTALSPFLEDLRSLKIGDYVVHTEHGIGQYQGLIHREVVGILVDLLCIEYAGGDKLYLPVYRLNQIQKWGGGGHGAPPLDRLGGSTFAKAKGRARKEVRQIADELFRLHAERQARPGYALPPLDDEDRAFEATFPFDETPDQAKAIREVYKDLESPQPTDRLVCGDVGFGKTEVAIRAAFRMVKANKQVALLCPTTVLAQQHLRTFENRFRDYPFTVKALSRFQSDKEQNATIAQLKEGKIDLIIGTHRLLSKDVHFKDLGLLIIDEEQRFGVVHKERLKKLRAHVDILTLTATPIPRTLQMAVSGLRELSLITTPPTDRRTIRTIVTRFEPHVLKDAIEREIARGGQVFYVYHRAEGLYEKAQQLQELLPHARIAVCHGQLGRSRRTPASEAIKQEGTKEGGLLEKVMLDFIEGRYDILVATTIIESGLDIPQANTMIIDRADLFGLAQLYQLRGRVGRSKERAYCYLIVPPPNAMTDDARARIEALERYTELGSGFQIASLDLELRGAGSLLGVEQSGNIASVGFDLFCHMLEEAVLELRGETLVEEVDPELSLDLPALLPEEYVGDMGIRLSFYKRFAGAPDEAAVTDIAEELEQRFGPLPEEAKNLVQLMMIKTHMRKIKALGCEANARMVTLHLRSDTSLDPQKVTALIRRHPHLYRLTPDMRLSRRFENSHDSNGLINAQTLLEELKGCHKDNPTNNLMII
ncbi:transcription-repair coupling factor [Pajaroellobacter abortibovis]|uniref:Transcription-repair-coupling factor n=1 Tax=Pajaroellobacter abortibovis TaxID=1882918 RepID=A0A1L6MYU2_9BACT|nr:transcription-repair coupling factor [Pajaroellobacter abortibovis]APS00676.1 transcription-repair coupling factor [Pajaroellobacter abortibovis]